MKVIGIGLNRTGTKTLGACLGVLGFHHLAWSPATYNIYITYGFSGLLRILAEYDSFEDWPWPLVYRDIDAAYPNSKFILTRRTSADTWYDSLCKHATRTGPTNMRKQIFGHAMPGGYRDSFKSYYDNHLATIREYFRDRPGDLLEVCWEENHGWREIASFLNRDVPDTQFPHKNKSLTG